jgi:hypothetical protein
VAAVSTLPPPPPPPAAPRRTRRWPWLLAVAALAVALVASLAALVRVRQDRDDLADRVAALEAATPPSSPGSAPSAGTDEPRSPETETETETEGETGGERSPEAPARPEPESGLEGALDGLLGSAAGVLGGLDPRCLLDGGVPPLTGSGVDGTVEEQVTQLADLVQSDRGLRFVTPADPAFLPADEFDERVGAEVAASYDAASADLDARVLELLGAIPPRTDLKALQEDLLAGQVAGFYDPDTGEVVVRVADGTDSLPTTDQLTLAHELDHALTDQALGLPDTGEPGQSDANLARLALVEGDATLLMQRIALAEVGILDQLGESMSPEMAASQAELDALPPYLRNELLFPYLAGLAYVCRLHVDGGWAAVDEAYEALPATTAEILFPGRGGRPLDVADPPVPSGWDEARRDTLGAAQLLWLFGAPGGSEAAAIGDLDRAVRAWAGGELLLATAGDRSAVGLSLLDRGGDGVLCEATGAWYEAAFDPQVAADAGSTVYRHDDRVAVLTCGADTVRLGIAPTLEDAARLTR